MTHQQAAEAVGRSRAAVTNLLRLLELTEEIKELVERGDLEMGHARALILLVQLSLAHRQASDSYARHVVDGVAGYCNAKYPLLDHHH